MHKLRLSSLVVEKLPAKEEVFFKPAKEEVFFKPAKEEVFFKDEPEESKSAVKDNDFHTALGFQE